MMHFTKLRVAAAAGLLAFSALPATAMAQSYNPDRVVKSIVLGDLEAVVGSLGHSIEDRKVSGDNSLRAKDEDGTIYLLIGTACDVGDVKGCQGIMMQVLYDIPKGVTYETVAKANAAQAAIGTWVDFDDNTLGFTRYVVLDHGVTMANVRENVKVLLGVYPAAMDVAKGKDGN